MVGSLHPKGAYYQKRKRKKKEGREEGRRRKKSPRGCAPHEFPQVAAAVALWCFPLSGFPTLVYREADRNAHDCGSMIMLCVASHRLGCLVGHLLFGMMQ